MKKLIIGLSFGLVSLSAAAGGNIENGKALAAKYNCASCHGADYNKPIDPSYPKLAGQHAEYLEKALPTSAATVLTAATTQSWAASPSLCRTRTWPTWQLTCTACLPS